MAFRFRRAGWIFLFIFLVIMIALHSCMTFRMSPTAIDRFFEQHKIKGTQHSYKVGNRAMHYVEAGNSTKPLVVFLHGSPGSLSAFIDFLSDSTLLKNTLLITADRPGFGYSNFGRAEPSLQKQAELLKPILEKYSNNRPIILVGHSLGGPLIARMAMDYPNLVDALVIVAGSVDPDLEPNETWFRAPFATPVLRWILPRSFRASNDEIYKLKPQLERMKSLWSSVICRVIVIQGDKDSLVDPKNADFLKKMLVNAPTEIIRIKDTNHFIPWTNPEVVKNAILKLVDRQ